MMTRWQHLRGGSADRSREGGYVAVMTALLLTVFMGFAAFAVDVGHWYLVGQQEQRAADAAAMAGVTYLPGNPTTAFTTAQNYSKINGFQNGVSATVVTPAVDAQPTRLRVTVSQTVSNFFGSLMGVPTTKVARTAVADYAGPVPLGSPCNEFGADPDVNGHQSTNCNGEGAFWANVGSLSALKSYGDAFQDNVCASGVDGCTGSTNTDFDPNGYFYTVTVTQAMANLTIQAFDPAMINVGDYCGAPILPTPKKPLPQLYQPDPGNLIKAMTLPATKTVVSDPSTRYANGATAYCTGDNRFGGTGEVATQFTVRSPGLNPWDPLSFLPIGGTCTQTFAGYNGDLSLALDKTNAAYTSRPDVAANFRQWKTLCTIAPAKPGTYLVQVNTNGEGSDAASGHNRFSLRAYGGSSAENDSLAVAGYDKMAMYGNTPNGTTKFFLARVPSGAKGQTFNVNLFDIGDGAVSGSTVTVLPPTETVPATFSNCTGVGVQNGALSNCQINVDSSYNGKWQTISVPIPSTYSCTDASTTGCWLRLQFFYGTGSTPNDTTSWTASIVGDPVRLVQ
jgi:Flp pilus assembly protein TadG